MNSHLLYRRRTAAVMAVLLSLLFSSACGTSTPTSTPTPDLDPFRTEVAATVLAQVSQTAAAAPSATPVPSLTPTFASIVPSATATAVFASVPISPTATLAGGTPLTTTQATPATQDRAEWVAQSIADGTIFKPGETFTITWSLRNTGSSTWTVAYLFRFYSGNNLGAPNELLLGRVVLPGETVDISIPMTAPAIPGEYRTDWVLSNESRSNFKQPVFLKITVVVPPTSTPAPAQIVTATANATVESVASPTP